MVRTVLGKSIFETIGEVIDPKHTALLVIDMANDQVNSEGVIARRGADMSMIQGIVPTLRRLIDEARGHGMMIVYTQNMISVKNGKFLESPAYLAFLAHHFNAYDEELLNAIPGIEGTWGAEIIDALKPSADDIVIQKHRSSAFHNSNLDLLLRSNGIKTTIITGCVTSGCVASTARDAGHYDYYVVVAADCVAAYNKTVHDAALLVLSDRYPVLTADEIIQGTHPNSEVALRIPVPGVTHRR